MLFQALLLAIASIAPATADFIISNSTVCHGVPRHCPHGAQVITLANTPNYSCDSLVPAQDNAYIFNGTIGPFGSNVLSANSVCGNSVLRFERRVQDDGYDVQGEEGEELGLCRPVEVVGDVLGRTCDLWLTMVTFHSAYLCESGVCED